jgi:hypothetical protein
MFLEVKNYKISAIFLSSQQFDNTLKNSFECGHIVVQHSVQKYSKIGELDVSEMGIRN